MVLQALEECPATPTELEEIRSLIERRKNQPKQGGGA